MQVVGAIQHLEPKPLTEFGQISAAVAAVVRKALSKKPADRYQTAREMWLALRKACKMYDIFISYRRPVHVCASPPVCPAAFLFPRLAARPPVCPTPPPSVIPAYSARKGARATHARTHVSQLRRNSRNLACPFSSARSRL